jgi:arabinofuranan 3-O-arabinosyltransferase
VVVTGPVAFAPARSTAPRCAAYSTETATADAGDVPRREPRRLRDHDDPLHDRRAASATMTTRSTTAAPATATLRTTDRGAHGAGDSSAAGPPASGPPASAPPARGLEARAGLLEHLLLAGLVLVPLLAVARGVVSSDTKTYLYLDPARFLGQVASMWYPTAALGTVTHQYIGYLFPMGPYYAATAALHVPTWIAQRLWLGAILFGAGAGVLCLCRTIRVRRPGSTVAALAYMLSPYLLQYSGRISVILMPWAALPWLVALTARALAARRSSTRPASWRYAALFALVVALSSGINASSVLYVVVGPLLWLAWAVAAERDASWRDAGVVLAQLGVLSALVSAWWIVGLMVEAGFGVDILRYTESVRATSSTSTPLEVLRGLGYWYFYGGGKSGPWTQSVVLYTRWLWLVGVSYLVPLLAFVSAVLVRWRWRGYFVALTVVGVVLSVGAYPYTAPTPVGAALKAFMNGTTAGLAMRSTDRATPLALLGLAMLLGAGVAGLAAAWRGRAWLAGIVTSALFALILAANPALFNGDAAVVDGLTQPASLPAYDLAAARYLNAVHRGTRVLAIPGNAFAAYTWGDTTDTPQPALLTRPFVTREQQVMGSIATADTLYAIDAPIQAHIQSWSALAPMARLVSAGDVLVEYDQTSARYGSPQAVTLAETLARTPPGLAGPKRFGLPGQRVAAPTVDTELLAGTLHAKKPPPVAVYTVAEPRPIVRAESDAGALVVAGDATGLETLAAQGMLDTKSAIYYAGSLDRRPSTLRRLAANGATLVLTDTNRKQGFRWNGLSANAGQIQTARNDATTRTPSDSPIDLFATSRHPSPPSGSRTVATYIGAADVTASSYGNPVTYQPEDRAYSAIDGDLRTAWETGTFTPDVDGQWWQVDFGHRVTANHVTVVQPLFGTRKRAISKVTLTFTGSRPVTVRLRAASRRREGQRVRFSRRAFRTLRITIDATTKTRGTPVGFAEVEVPGQHVAEIDQMPTDLLGRLGRSSLRDRLVIAMTRTRGSPYTTAQADPQMVLARSFTLPTARTFTLSGTATLSPLLTDTEIGRLVGVPGATGTGVVATSSSRLTGALGDTAAAAADGNPATLWQSGFGAHDVDGAWLQYRLPAPLTFATMSLRVVADRRHSVPAALEVTAFTRATGRTETRQIALPFFLRSAVPGTTVSLPVSFPALRGTRIRVTFDRVREKRAPLADHKRSEILPLGITELGIPGLRVPPPPASLPGTCQRDLLRLDGHPLALKVVGSVASALHDGQVSIEPCGADARGIRLAAGHHVLESALATAPAVTPAVTPAGGAARGVPDVPDVPDVAGWNIDELTLSSAAGGGPAPASDPTAAPTPGAAPRVRAHQTSATAWTLDVRHATQPFELVLGESLNAGWHAVARPAPGARPGSRAVTLGPPQLVDAFANGWQVSRADLRLLGGTGFSVSLTWTPQRAVWVGIAVSAAALLACLALAVFSRRKRRKRRNDGAGAAAAHGGRRADAAFPIEPSLALPGTGGARRRLRWWAVAGVALLVGALAASISTPVCGVGVAVAVAAGLTYRRLRILGAGAAVGLLAAAVGLVVVGQALHPAAGGGNWPHAYHDAATLAAMAVAFLGADAIVDYAAKPAPTDTG